MPKINTDWWLSKSVFSTLAFTSTGLRNFRGCGHQNSQRQPEIQRSMDGAIMDYRH